jgi:Bcr/CflA subfamily drug resistance transporter
MSHKREGLEGTKEKYLCILLLIAIIATAKFMYYLYIPALPAIGKDFAVGKSLVTSSLTFAMVGVGISILFYGPLSDSYGRKKVMMSGILIMIIGFVLSIFAYTPSLFLLSRLIQGLGAGSIAVLLKLMIKDLFDGEDLAWAASTFAMFVSLLPAIAPFLGGLILIFFDWKIIFVVLLIYAVIILFVIAYHVEETLEKSNRSEFSLFNLFRSYLLLFKHKDYLIVVFSMVLSFSCLGIYLTGSSFLFQVEYKYSSSQFGTIIILPTLFFAIGCFLAAKLSSGTNKYYPIIKGAFLILVSGIILLVLHPLGIETALSTIIMLSVLGFAVGFTYSNCFAGMLKRIPVEAKGAGVAFANAVQLIFSGIIIYAFSFLHFTTTVPFGFAFIIIAILIIFLMIYLFRITPKEYIVSRR